MSGYGDVPLWCLGEQPRTEAERDPYRALNTRVVGVSGRELREKEKSAQG